MTQEKIICAAIKVQEHIFYGHRHNHCIQAMIDKLSYTLNRQEISKLKQEQGFITNFSRFVNREEAFDIALAAGQLQIDEKACIFRLFSEDLY